MAPERITHQTPAERHPDGERAAALRTWLSDRKIRAVLFDMDDTILDTHTHIRSKLDLYRTYLYSRLPHITPQEIDSLVERSDLTVFGTHSVSNDRWNGLATLVAAACNAPPDVYREGSRILLSMYETSPKPFPHAVETLKTFRDAVPKLGVVTHANREYTTMKLAANGLDRLFDHIEIADEWGHKSANDWSHAIRALGVDPSHVLVVGDSVKGDMQAARAAGVDYLVHLPSPWEPYRDGQLPKGVIEAASIADVIPTLLTFGITEKE